jgi:hypothetical protein
VRKRDRFEVIDDFRSLNHGGIPFPVDRSIAEQGEVTNRFGDHDFASAVCTCFMRKSDRFEGIRDYRALHHGGFPFPVDGSIAQQK